MGFVKAAVVMLLSAAVLSSSGCNGADVDVAKRNLLAAYAQNGEADWRLERERPEAAGFYGIPRLEDPLISHGQAAVPVAQGLLRSFDHRVRCSGLTILVAIHGVKNMQDVLIDHLDDPYEPIRWKCWHLLRDRGLVTLESMPTHEDYLSRWLQVKRQARMRLTAEEERLR